MRLLGVVFLVVAAVVNSYAQDMPAFKESRKPPVKPKKGQEYTFGYLQVPENRSDPASGSIQLPVYIFKSRSSAPKKDPVIYMVGGPGSSILNAVPYMAYYEYLNDRDFILLEQRGTTYAKPHLACPEWSQAIRKSGLPNVSEQQRNNMLEMAAKSCSDRLLKKGADLNGYNTKESAEDVETLRKLLGIEEYNLLTLSYGTKIAQTLMRMYPEPIRSVVMDSALPLEVDYDLESIDNLMNSYDRIFADCKSDSACSKAFPDLRVRFYTFLEEATEQPVRVEVVNPETKQDEVFLLKGEDFALLLTLFSTDRIASLPQVIHNIIEGDMRFVKPQLEALFTEPGNGDGMGMRLSVWCAEETAFVSSKSIDSVKAKYAYLGSISPAVFEKSICDVWGVEPLGELENMPVKSDIPTLLINGEYDNETPAKWAFAMQQNLSNSHVMVFKGYMHTPTTYWSNPCGMQVANHFFNNPYEKPLLDCFMEMKAPVFITDD